MPPTGLEPAAIGWSRRALTLDRAGTALHLPPAPEAAPAADVLARAVLREYTVADPDSAAGEWLLLLGGHLITAIDTALASPFPQLVRPLAGVAHG
ncbi:hypothetical protein J0910_30560 [Nocardiopsis sp. CNT-189]|uniref:hypothetical protein n=1 Tax=Nocardiopsis oceanisediminis TaxID=2816862 RepID=UPI003B3676AA